MCWFCMSFYLESYIWSDVISWWIWHRNRSNFLQISGKVWRRPSQLLESMSRTKKVQTHWDWRRRDWWRAKSAACSSFSLTSNVLNTQNSSWQAKQSVLLTTVTSYGDCMEMCDGFTTFRIVAQCLNQLCYCMPANNYTESFILYFSGVVNTVCEFSDW
jgi:hypothetical protein